LDSKSKLIVFITFAVFIFFPVKDTFLLGLMFENLVLYFSVLKYLDAWMLTFMLFNCWVMVCFLLWLFPFSFYYWNKAVDEFESLKKLRGRAKNITTPTPHIAVVIPAFNEEKTIVQTIRSCQHQNWKPRQIIIIDDGSTDKTAELVINRFNLKRRFYVKQKPRLPQKGAVTAIYSNGIITLISKVNAGKSYALNLGFDYINRSTEYACIFDADTISHEEGVMGLIYPMVEDRDLVLTSGRNQIVNGCHVIDGKVVQVGVTKNPLILSQIREYLVDLVSKAFGNSLDAQAVLIGNFSGYRIDAVYKLNGFADRGMTEDYDYNFHVHAEKVGKIRAILTAQGWTQGPHSLSGVFNQRVRWSVGILDSLIRYRKVAGRPDAMGKFFVPVQMFKAIVFPIYFIANFSLIPLAIYLWMTNPHGHLVESVFMCFYLPAYIMKFVMEVGIHNYIDWKYIKNYNNASTYVWLAMFKMFFGYAYNSILLTCNAVAYWKYFWGTATWGKMERTKVD